MKESFLINLKMFVSFVLCDFVIDISNCCPRRVH